jgi:hypothetical protein
MNPNAAQGYRDASQTISRVRQYHMLLEDDLLEESIAARGARSTFLDAYCGFEWAMNHIRPEVRGEMEMEFRLERASQS